ncbi:MAG TPA: hypothetical protein VI790_05750 [Candidatus Nanoarchaeia archaeon]|nr:hypothetical protein [Candidatus Nanoarchaeia archaeon]
MSTDVKQYVSNVPALDASSLPLDLSIPKRLRIELLDIANRYYLNDVAIGFFDTHAGSLGKILAGFENSDINDDIDAGINNYSASKPISIHGNDDALICSYFFETANPSSRGGKNMFTVITNVYNLNNDFYKNLESANFTENVEPFNHAVYFKKTVDFVKSSIKSVAEAYTKLFEKPEVIDYIAKKGLKSLLCA